MTNKVLVVDDEKLIVKGIKFSLEQDGMEVPAAYDGKEAYELAMQNDYDIILLDVMLPELNGFEVCQMIREKSDVPIIMLTAKGDDMDKILGLEYGADDYVTKPFPMSVFQKKLAVVLGRLTKQYGGDTYEDGTLTINFSEMSATLSGKPLTFTPLEYRLLKILMKNPQIVLTRQVLLEKLWDADGNFVDEHALTAAISRVRNKIETPDRQYIKTVYGMGYMWIGGVLK